MSICHPATTVSALGRLRTAVVLDGFCILGAFAALLIVIATLGAFGFGVGFDVFPFGEDNNWVDMLQRGPGAEAARLFWALDHRNPLSPWWYIAARQIILGFDAGLLSLRYAVALLLAIAAYCMVVTVAGRQARAFALGIAMVSVFWMANHYPEQIIWNFQGALAASLFSVAAYARFLDEGGHRYRLYAISIALWFVAFTTYTIQCGAVLAIGYLAFSRARAPNLDTLRSVRERARAAVLDTLPYIVLFGLFLLLWQTTMGPLAAAASFHFSGAALLQSLREGVWTSDFRPFYRHVFTSPDRLAFISAAAVCGAAAFLVLNWRERRHSQKAPGISGRRLVDVLAVVACVAAPTVALESGSDTWVPGSRWPMIYQLTSPVLLLAIVVALLAAATPPLRARLWRGAVALAIAIGALFSLGQNGFQVEITANEKFVRDSIQRLVAEDFAAGLNPPTQILLMLGVPNRLRWRSRDILSPTIARAWLQTDEVSFRLVPWSEPRDPPGSYEASWWRIQFGPDAEGVGNAKVGGGAVPYQELRILSINGRSARRLTRVDREDFAGFDVQWNRDGPIALPAVDPAQLCPIAWSADRDPLSKGWDAREQDARGPVRWTTSLSARLTFATSCGRRSLLKVVAAYALSMRNIEHLTLLANGRQLDYRRTFSDGNIVYEAELDQQTLSARPLLDIDLGVDFLDAPAGVARRLGIAIRSVEIVPIED
jgi:hypothetical protein